MKEKNKHNWITPKPDIEKYRKQSIYYDVEEYYSEEEDSHIENRTDNFFEQLQEE